MQLPPGPPHPALYSTVRWLTRPLEYWDRLHARYGDTFTMRLPGLPPLVIFSNPDAVREVFLDDGVALHAGEFNRSLAAFLGEHSVLMLDGPEHLRQRKLLLPPFHGERMQAYGPAMISLTHEAIDRLPLRRPFALHPELQGITLRVIIRTLFGIDEGPRFERVVGDIAELTELASWPPLLLPFMQLDLGPRSPWGKFLRKMREFHALLIEEVRACRRAAGGRPGRTDVLSLLAQARDESGAWMTEDELKDQLVTLLVAGHETTTTALAWTLRWILDSPRVRARLDQEIRQAVGPDGALSPERIAKLEYLDAVIREGLRLQPVIPLVGRVLQRDMTVGGWDLPKGCAVVCSIYLAQRRPEIYPEPARFEPERFLGKKFTPHELFPFGGGIRRCIGMAFALYEMKMVLATLLSRAELRLAPGPEVRVVRRAITLVPSGGLRVVMDSRRPQASPPARGKAESRDEVASTDS